MVFEGGGRTENHKRRDLTAVVVLSMLRLALNKQLGEDVDEDVAVAEDVDPMDAMDELAVIASKGKAKGKAKPKATVTLRAVVQDVRVRSRPHVREVEGMK